VQLKRRRGRRDNIINELLGFSSINEGLAERLAKRLTGR
jgi:hypothetical protein